MERTITNIAKPLRGELVELERLTVEHAAPLWDAAQDGDVWTWLPVDGGRSRAAFDRWLDWMLSNAETAPAVPFVVFERGGERVLGTTSYYVIAPEHLRVEIGMTWYAQSAWGTGANVEGKLLMLTRAFDELGYRRVEFKTDASNVRSRAALAALPAQFEGVLRKHMVVQGGRRRDSAYYSVIDDEWPSVRANLEQRLALHLEAARA